MFAVNILVGLAAVLVVFVVASAWSIYELGKRGNPRVAIGVASALPYTLLNPVFWIVSIGVFLVCYFALKSA